jgi:hypothetical protein
MAGTDTSVATRLWQKIVGVSQDGSFGAVTKTATINWQKNNGLSADGIVGQTTWKKAESLGLTDPFDVSELPMLKAAGGGGTAPKPPIGPIKPPTPGPSPSPNIIPSLSKAGWPLWLGLGLIGAFLYKLLTKKDDESRYIGTGEHRNHKNI